MDLDRAAAPIDCTSLLRDPDLALQGVMFIHEDCRKVELFDPSPLDTDAEYVHAQSSVTAPDAGPRTCDAVRLRAEGLDTVIAFVSSDKTTIDLGQDLLNHLDHEVLIEQVGRQLYLSADTRLVVRSNTAQAGRADCSVSP
jgi:hypothetical protein